MIVTCDTCGAKFQLADEKITDKGTKVRCSKCKNIFTVKKGKEGPATAAEAAAAPGPPTSPPAPAAKAPAKAGGPAAAPGAGGKEDDPFADFSFSEDMDFEEGEEGIKVEPPKPDASAVPPPHAGVGPSFIDEGPSVTFAADSQKPQIKSEPPPAEEGFDFKDEDFSLSGEPAPKPAAAPPVDDSGDFKFDDDSFAETGAAPSPPPPPARPAPAPPPPPKPAAKAPAPPAPPKGPTTDEWGNLSFSDDTPEVPGKAAPTKAPGEEGDEGGFGDFKFDSDDHLPPAAGDEMGEGVSDFVRSQTSKAEVRDDLEASLGDSEPEPERTEKKVERPEPPPPPKPAVRPERKAPKSRKGLVIGIILLLVIGAPFGGLFYTDSKGWFTFKDLLAGNFGNLRNVPALAPLFQKIAPPPEPVVEPPAGDPKVDEASLDVTQLKRFEEVTLADGRTTRRSRIVVMVAGKVVNASNRSRSAILVKIELLNEAQEVVGSGQSFCGVSFSEDELAGGKSEDEIVAAMNSPSGRYDGCIAVPPNDAKEFAVVFFTPPPETKLKLRASVVSSEIVQPPP